MTDINGPTRSDKVFPNDLMLVTADGTKFPVSRARLESSSKVFRDMLSIGGSPDAEVDAETGWLVVRLAQDDATDVVKAGLSCLDARHEGREMEVLEDHEVFRACTFAKKYQIPVVMERLEHCVLRQHFVSPDDKARLFVTLAFAETTGDEQVRKAALDRLLLAKPLASELLRLQQELCRDSRNLLDISELVIKIVKRLEVVSARWTDILHEYVSSNKWDLPGLQSRLKLWMKLKDCATVEAMRAAVPDKTHQANLSEWSSSFPSSGWKELEKCINAQPPL